MHADYVAPDSGQTLAEAIAEYYAIHPGLSDWTLMDDTAQRFFRSHDVAHVVFGCGIDLPDEAVVKVASVFGTTGGFGVLRGYRLEDSRRIYTRITPADVVATAARSVRSIPRMMWRCARQVRRWPWPTTDHAPWQRVRLCDLRREFGIQVAHG